MERRNFIRNGGIALAGLTFGVSPFNFLHAFKDQIIGHNSHRYKIDLNWGALDSSIYPVKDCHEMVQDSKGRIVLLTNHTKNNVIVYDKSGKLIEVWGTKFPGAHGLTLNVEAGEDFLYITDIERHSVFKTSIDGKVVMEIKCPDVPEKYKKQSTFLPTETCIHENGDIYIADGYGEQYISHYNSKGQLLNIFGGKGNENHHFNNAHGICIDNRNPKNPTLLITARMQNKLKRFTLAGEYLSSIDLPGAYICRPVIDKDNVYLATIWSGNGEEGSGFVSILDKDNKLISAPGGSTPIYSNGKLEHMHQTLKIFTHPHDVCVDEDENLYIAQWNSNQTYPIKLKRV